MQACRTCLSRYELIPLFGEFSVHKFSSDQLFLSTGIKIEANDGLPQSACRPCIKKITKALDFREISSKVDQMLRNYMIKHDAVIQTEQNCIYNINDEVQTVNIVSSFDTQRNDKNFVLDDAKESHGFDSDSCSNDSTSSAKCKEQINTKSVLNDCINGTKKYTTEQNKPNNINTDLHNSDIDSKNSNTDCQNNDTDNENSDTDNTESFDIDNTYLAEEVDTKPILEINIIDRHPICEDKNNTDEVLIDNDKNDGLKTSNKKQIHGDAKTFTKNTSKKLKMCSTETKKYKTTIFQSFCNIKFDVTDLSEEDKALGKISNIRLEDILSKEEMNDLFNDKEVEEASLHTKNEDIPKRNEIRKKNDIPRSTPSLINNRYSNYIKQMSQKETCEMMLRRRTAVDRRSDEAKELDVKLMSLAVTPYSPGGPVQCTICNQRVRSEQSFKAHAKTHFEPEFACLSENCNRKFYCRSNLRYHQQRKHGREKRLACSYCTFRAVDRNTIRNHERAEHTGERPYICAECGAAFRMRNNLLQHLIMHFGVRNIQCEFCPSLFTRRNQLWSHQMKVHFMTYTYHCYLCPETYKGLRPVKNHLLNTHGVPEDQQLKIKCVKTRK